MINLNVVSRYFINEFFITINKAGTKIIMNTIQPIGKNKLNILAIK